MNWTYVFVCLTVISVFSIIYLEMKLVRVREQLSIIREALEDIKNGNRNRRILARENDMTKTICYSMNEIAANDQIQFIRMKQSEQAYKRLMTSLSHDVKTPLTSLVAYLEAIQEKMVTGEEKEEYLSIALDKAYHLDTFVESLFEWVKLDAGEQVCQFERYDLNELTRDILADWIPTLEDKKFDYSIDIPDLEFDVQLDRNAYMRILNNLLQNALLHSDGNAICLQITEDEKQAVIHITDNGKGISTKDLPHIFEWLYQADESRGGSGNGFGLAIVRELVAIHGGTIHAELPESGGTAFIISLPKAL